MITESTLRKWHRIMGIFLAVFIFIQVGSGTLLTLSQWSVAHTHANSGTSDNGHGHEEGAKSLLKMGLRIVHHGAGTGGDVFRLITGFGVLGMAASGSMIFFKIRVRTRKK